MGAEIERAKQRCHGFAASKFLRDAIEVCAEYIRNVRGMRPAPGTERAAHCEEGCWEGDEPVPHRQLAIKDLLA